MSESRKFYNRGVKNFHNGNLEKAIANLDIAISHDMKNSAALNLRGIIYYIKGQSEKALASWQINVDFNDDSIAMGHIESFENDGVNTHRYKSALVLIKEHDYSEAIVSLEAATYTDYNILNVRNALAYCYIKEGEYEKAKLNIELVLEKDKNNESVQENIDILKKESGISLGISRKKYIAIATCVIVVLAGGFTVMDNSKKVPVENDSTASLIIDKEDKVNGNKEDVSDSKKEDANTISNSNSVDLKALKDFVVGKNFVEIEKNLSSAKTEGLSELELEVVEDAKKLMTTEGIQYFYKEGTDEFNAKNFGKAKEVFIKALNYSEGTYLDSHITYMLSVSCENLDDTADALKYYGEYEKNAYEDSGYREEVLYKLAILNKKEGNETSKDFANKLVSEYPDSIYNNDNIKAILEN